MANNAKTFLVSTADFILKYNGVVACTGTTNLNTSIEVSMQEQNVNAGKGNKLAYSFKYGRELSPSLEAADWKLEFIAVNVGSKITEGLNEVYKMGECVQLTAGVGVLASTPIGDVAIELPNGTIVTVTPDTTSVDLSAYGMANESVKATYQYSRNTKKLVIDAESSPMVYELILDADKHNNKLGKVGSVQIVVPSFQPDGNFTISFTPDGVTSTTINGKALAVEGERCSDGASVYAYINEFDDTETVMQVSEIAATPATITLDSAETSKTATISVIGLKGALYAPIQLENAECEFVSDAVEFATVDENGVVTPVTAGNAKIIVTYDGKTDEIDVVVK